MKKEWKNYDVLRHCEPSSDEFLEQFEKKLDADRDAWMPRAGGLPPIGGEAAIPLEEAQKGVKP
jgi:hypothetical protein